MKAQSLFDKGSWLNVMPFLPAAILFLLIIVVWIYVSKALIFLAGGASALPVLGSIFYYIWPLSIFTVILATGFDQEMDTPTLATVPTERFSHGRFAIGWGSILTITFFLLPIIFNGISSLLYWLEILPAIGQLFFEYRWLVQVIPPLILFVGSVVGLIIISGYRFVQDRRESPIKPDWEP